MAKGIVKFDVDKCKGCELCVAACPTHIIKLQPTLNVKAYHPVGISEEDMEKCVACANCAIMCPDSIISVYKED